MLLSCPACDSRYDITGRVSGESFRCQCGATMKLAAVPPSATDVPSRATDRDRSCPRCAAALHPRRIGDIVIDECSGCLGVFLDHATIKQVTGERARTRAEALLGALPRVELNPLPSAGQKMYLPCPICHVVMNRRLFASGTGVIIDVCRTHGTFFDAGELPQMIEFVMKGWLDQPPRRHAPPTHEPRHEISPSLPVSLPIARLHHDPSQPRTAAGAFVEFLASIFD